MDFFRVSLGRAWKSVKRILQALRRQRRELDSSAVLTGREAFNPSMKSGFYCMGGVLFAITEKHVPCPCLQGGMDGERVLYRAPIGVIGKPFHLSIF
jgi:hypothetical protein